MSNGKMSGNRKPYEAAVEELEGLPRFKGKPTLARMRHLLQALGNPQDRLKVIHVAGTNGKGSVCALLAGILGAAGIRTGLFTSPHLLSMTERIQVDGMPIPEEEFAALYGRVAAAARQGRAGGATFFERLAAMAFLHFAEREVEAVVLETGLGGLWDATNVVEKPSACIITRIGLDHTEVLGDTLEEVAFQKAGILKAGVPVVAANDPVEVEKVLESRALSLDSPWFGAFPYETEILGRTDKSIDFCIRNKYYRYERLKMGAFCPYQLENANLALTWAAVQEDFPAIREEHLRQGLEHFRWPGRMEFLAPNILLDGAHNTNGMERLVEALEAGYGDRDLEILLAVKEGKAFEGMLEALVRLPNLRRLGFCPIRTVEGIPPSVLEEKAKALRNDLDTVSLEDFRETLLAYMHQEREAEKPLLCCLGSLYFIAEVRGFFEEVCKE
ncbi:bifunctional folylpolyglutamate synthase/dihydrofolate synthase [Anaerotalea alkaliphila]|uniref:tetrahydrofolate synthase n=1 Tax=Anaerotalea alkaliphila TaxID=2662126 RepID=A0A7X5HX06_9FIRM|nr:folylpolyglutamate synthase/dihydrofolate synthase family protein [Anaerotalea alkaliphila]NDL68202.1 bifunctional folylpolyglutamate synthase/dihydrofolate synthase [Anaerotalea alkaliphila]